MFVVEGRVMLEALNAPVKAPMTMKPFMLVIAAVMATEVSPETGCETERVGVV